ncbi:MAG: hypothetical protein JJU35_14575, partial [Balneolales bacterium]|nr:hypothetical protein [Balneolales bacterium]
MKTRYLITAIAFLVFGWETSQAQFAGGIGRGDSRGALEAIIDPDPGTSDFATFLSVSDAGSNSITLTIGTAPDATSGFDPQYDQFAPPPGPAGTFDARISFEGEDYFRFFEP